MMILKNGSCYFTFLYKNTPLSDVFSNNFPLCTPKTHALTFNTILKMCNTGKITDEELRERAGFPPEKPEGTITEV